MSETYNTKPEQLASLKRWRISFFASAQDARPRGSFLDRSGLVSLLATPEICTEKSDRKAWSAARYPDGARRGYGQVLDVSCLVLDYDDTSDIGEGADHWERWAHIVHTTWSHTLEAPRFRIVVPLVTPIARDRYRALWEWADANTGHAIDRACKDPCRLWFLPCVAAVGAPFFSEVHEGMLLDWRALDLPADVAPQKRMPLPPISVALPDVDAEVKRRLLEDEDTRARVADSLGATIYRRNGGRVAQRITCPGCGRRSVWYWISVCELRRARCSHHNSCSWTGHLWELS